jgi:hypothetical protein
LKIFRQEEEEEQEEESERTGAPIRVSRFRWCICLIFNCGKGFSFTAFFVYLLPITLGLVVNPDPV